MEPVRQHGWAHNLCIILSTIVGDLLVVVVQNFLIHPPFDDRMDMVKHDAVPIGMENFTLLMWQELVHMWVVLRIAYYAVRVIVNLD